MASDLYLDLLRGLREIAEIKKNYELIKEIDKRLEKALQEQKQKSDDSE